METATVEFWVRGEGGNRINANFYPTDRDRAF